jgi:hypothetical protein
MSSTAKVKSIEALEAFRVNLLVYRDKAGRIVDEFRDEVVRTRIWLQTDRQLHWKRQVHERARDLARAEQELLTARLSGHPEVIQERRMAVHRARAALREAEDGLARVRHWLQHYETEVESPSKAVLQLRDVLANDLAKAVAFLEGAASVLADYAALAPGQGPAPSGHNQPTPAPDVIGPGDDRGTANSVSAAPDPP